MINIYDANAWLRRSLNRVQLGGVNMDPRVLYNEMLASPDVNIWVWDGPNNNARRQALFPGYKVRDYTGQENIFAGLEVYRRLLDYAPVAQLEVPNWEADDVCATLARRYASQGNEVTIYTNDMDYQQLLGTPRVFLKGFKTNDTIPPQFIPLYKALVGDKSDKIPGIPGFGDGAWSSLRQVWPVLDRALRERDVETFRNQPWKPAIKAWLANDDNVELIFIYHQITQMLEVPIDEINAYFKLGVADPVAAEQLFSEFML